MNPFYITRESKLGLETYILKHTTKKWDVEIIPSLGARVNRFELSIGAKRHSIIKGFKNHEKLKNLGVSGYYGAHLFPFPNRIQNGAYTFNGVDYKLPVNEPTRAHALHGLLHDQQFQYVKQHITKSGASISFEYAIKGGFKGFPFSFVFTVSYNLDNNGLGIEATVENKDRISFPVGYGWHPYIDLDARIDLLQLQLSSDLFLELDQGLIPTGKTHKIDAFSKQNRLQDIILDTCFILDPTQKTNETIISNPQTNLKVALTQKSGFKGLNYVQLFTPEARDCLAIEPMSCPANAFNTDTSMIVLKTGEIHKWQYGLRIV